MYHSGHQHPVVQKVESAIRRINHYSVDNIIVFANAYPLKKALIVYEKVINILLKEAYSFLQPSVVNTQLKLFGRTRYSIKTVQVSKAFLVRY